MREESRAFLRSSCHRVCAVKDDPVLNADCVCGGQEGEAGGREGLYLTAREVHKDRTKGGDLYYDTDDEFIDDTELDASCVEDAVATKHAGFYIQRGEVEVDPAQPAPLQAAAYRSVNAHAAGPKLAKGERANTHHQKQASALECASRGRREALFCKQGWVGCNGGLGGLASRRGAVRGRLNNVFALRMRRKPLSGFVRATNCICIHSMYACMVMGMYM